MPMCQCPSCGNVFYQAAPYDSARIKTLLQKAEYIIDLCAEHFMVSPQSVKGKVRRRDMVSARHLSMYFIYNYCKYSFSVVGGLFSNRDHTTVMSACTRVKHAIHTKLDLYPHLKELLPSVEAIMESKVNPLQKAG